MQFSISRTALFQSLQKVIGVVPNRSTLQILTNILVYTEDQRLKLMGTDLELTIVSSVDATISEDGGLAIPAKILSDILKELPEQELQFEVQDGHRVLIKSNRGEYKISGESQNEFPTPPNLDGGQEISIPNDVLKRMIDKTTFATSTDELRPALTGVLCQFGSESLKMVATDGHRLVKIVNTTVHHSQAAQLIMPTKALNFINKHLDDGASVQVVFDDKHVLFTAGELRIISKIITEDYPDFERALPTSNEKNLRVGNTDFIASVKRISLFSNPMTNQIRLTIDPHQLTVSAEDVDVGGEATETIAAEFDADAMKIGYNAVYLLDVLRHVDADEVLMKLDNPLAGALVEPGTQNENEHLIMLVMPVRLNER